MKRSIIFALAAALLLTGCRGSVYSNHRDTEDLRVVEALGLDIEGEGLRLSLSCARGKEDKGAAVISRSGADISSAMSAAEDFVGERELFYAHSQYLIFGEEYARLGLESALDYLARSGELRLGLELFVLRGDTAEALITGSGEDSSAGKALAGISRDAERRGGGRPFSARETIRSLSSHGAALICALKTEDTEGRVFTEAEGVVPSAAGYAVIKNGVLAGWLEPELAAAAELMLGKLGSDGPALRDTKGGQLRLEYEAGDCKTKTKGDTVIIEARLRANLAEADTGAEKISRRDYLSALESELAEDMKERILKVLELSRELEADFLGLVPEGEDSSWLRTARFVLDCSAEISYTRDISDRMRVEGGDSIERG